MLSNIEAATKNIYGIYDDLNYLTKNNQVFYPKKKLILIEFIKSRIDFFNIVALQSQLTFDLHPHSSSASIYINETKLQRIIDNNITNALKYTKEFESIHIMVFENENYCIFEIASYSSLIKNTKKIFNAYHRENIHKEGLGLGLNLVKKICDEEEIKIELQSNKNVTSFKYYFQKVKS
jgi:signal transduction histidine kinase